MSAPRLVLLDAEPAVGGSATPDGAQDTLDLSALKRLGHLTVYPRSAPLEVAARLADATVAITNKVVLDRETLRRLPALKLVSVLATGVNIVDMAAAREQGIAVCNVPAYSTSSTAQHAFALLLELCAHVGLHAADVQSGGWSRAASFSYFRTPLIELDGLALGVVGYGAIGRRVAQLGLAFGMRVLVHTRSPIPDAAVQFVSKDELLQQSDAISLHCPLTAETHHFIDEAALRQVKPSAMLINCSRGPVVDEAALFAALEQRRLASAALDVLTEEPPSADHPLVRSPHCLITPHIAWATRAARERLLAATAANISAFLAGSPQNLLA